MLREDKRIRAKIPPLFHDLMSPHLQRVRRALSPGHRRLSWTSLGIDAYLLHARQTLAELELLIDRTRDIVEFRVEVVFKEIVATVLCELPTEESWTVEYFLEKTHVSRRDMGIIWRGC